MDKTLDLDELERVAREATQGEWVSFDRDTASNIYSAGNNGSLLAVCHSYTTDVSEKRPNAARRKANATYIATFDPPTILTLIAAARPAVVSDEVVPAMSDAYDSTLYLTPLKGRPAYIEAMRAALALLPGGVPDGWVLVPKEPTEAMVNAVWHHWLHGMGHSQECMRDALRAMLSASPKGSSRSQPSRTAQEPPSPTPCDLDQKSWEVEVRLQGTRILTLGHDHLAGVYDIDKYADAVRTCGEHLLAFIGNGEPVECFACHGSQQERWVGNGGNEEVGPCSVCCPDADTSGTNDQSRDEQNPSASPKEVSQ